MRIEIEANEQIFVKLVEELIIRSMIEGRLSEHRVIRFDIRDEVEKLKENHEKIT